MRANAIAAMEQHHHWERTRSARYEQLCAGVAERRAERVGAECQRFFSGRNMADEQEPDRKSAETRDIHDVRLTLYENWRYARMNRLTPSSPSTRSRSP